ncbi:MAG: four helix bundle protein [Acidobacteriota bacterium]
MATLPQEPQRELRIRLKLYALRVLRLYDSLPRYGSAQVIGRQLARSGTSPGAQYREACRAKSDADFVSKIEGAPQELDESDYWLDMLIEGKYVQGDRLALLKDETDELIAILVTIVRKVKGRQKH